MATAPLHSAVLQSLGQSIASGEIAPGSVLTLEEISARFGVSRSVSRDVIGSLESLGMAMSRRRVGVIVQPLEEWNVLDSRVIKWRLNGPDRDLQLRTLTELRLGIEPIAAAATAQQIDGAAALQLRAIAEEMSAHGEAGHRAEFIDLDARFHDMILRRSGNELYAALAEPVLAAICGRSEIGLMPEHPEADAIRLHREVAEAIVARDSSRAEQAMNGILAEVRRTFAGIAQTR